MMQSWASLRLVLLAFASSLPFLLECSPLESLLKVGVFVIRIPISEGSWALTLLSSQSLEG